MGSSADDPQPGHRRLAEVTLGIHGAAAAATVEEALGMPVERSRERQREREKCARQDVSSPRGLYLVGVNAVAPAAAPAAASEFISSVSMRGYSSSLMADSPMAVCCNLRKSLRDPSDSDRLSRLHRRFSLMREVAGKKRGDREGDDGDTFMAMPSCGLLLNDQLVRGKAIFQGQESRCRSHWLVEQLSLSSAAVVTHAHARRTANVN